MGVCVRLHRPRQRCLLCRFLGEASPAFSRVLRACAFSSVICPFSSFWPWSILLGRLRLWITLHERVHTPGTPGRRRVCIFGCCFFFVFLSGPGGFSRLTAPTDIGRICLFEHTVALCSDSYIFPREESAKDIYPCTTGPCRPIAAAPSTPLVAFTRYHVAHASCRVVCCVSQAAGAGLVPERTARPLGDTSHASDFLGQTSRRSGSPLAVCRVPGGTQRISGE